MYLLDIFLTYICALEIMMCFYECMMNVEDLKAVSLLLIHK